MALDPEHRLVERENGTDRNRNARKMRKTYRFSKGWAVQEAVSYYTLYGYNFCRTVRTLRQGSRRKGYRPRDRRWRLAL